MRSRSRTRSSSASQSARASGGTSGARSGCCSSQRPAMVTIPLKSSARPISRSTGSRPGARWTSCWRRRPPTWSKAVREMPCARSSPISGEPRTRWIVAIAVGRSTPRRGLGHRVERRPAAGPACGEVGRTPLDLAEQVHRRLGEDLLADRHQQLVEPGDVVEDRPPRHPRARGDLLDGEPVGAVLGRQRPGGLEDGASPLLAQRAAAVGGRGRGHPNLLLHSVQIESRIGRRPAGDDERHGPLRGPCRSRAGSWFHRRWGDRMPAGGRRRGR